MKIRIKAALPAVCSLTNPVTAMLVELGRGAIWVIVLLMLLAVLTAWME